MTKLTILVTPCNGVGHVNSCSGALQAVLRRGHRIIFVIEEAFKGKLAALGYEEYLYRVEKSEIEKNPGESMCKMFFEAKVIGDYSVWEKMENMVKMVHSEQNYKEVTIFNEAIKEAIEKFKPDLIYQDGAILHPAIQYSGIPWIKNISITPICFLFLEGNEIPPAGSGFPSNGSLNEYNKFNKILRYLFYSKKYNNLIQQLGYEPYADDYICPETQQMTVYGYPEEINYPHVQSLDWFNLEVFNKAPSEVIELDKLLPPGFLADTLDGQFSGMFIYLSMGSMGSVDLELMKRLVKILGNTKHKFIVSKGPRHTEYDLSRNMFGDRYLPQTALIPHVDLVITHGGNNTVTETFAQGKPMIVLPLFGDQFDNAQRLHETGYGVRIEPYQFTEIELISAMEKLLMDQNLKQKLEKASKRIQELNQHEELAQRIEKFATGLFTS